MVYFIQGITGGLIKIGTTVRLTERLRTLCKEYGEELRVLAVIDGSYQKEKSLHRRFSHINIENEWFSPSDDLLGFIVETGREWDGTDEAQPRNDEAIRIRSDVAAKARIAASYLGLSITDYVSNVLEPIVSKDINEGHARISKGFLPKKPKRTESSE
jgi:hypothetical protein